MSEYHIDTKEQLLALYGEANDIVKMKMATELDEAMIDFIAKSSLVFISTIDANGNLDISPKGDPAGFVLVENNSLVHIPDRPGNKLIFGFNNLIDNPAIGVIFVTPNCRETLRIKGKAILTTEPQLLARLTVADKPALLATSITINECFFHCGKAMIRSKVWSPESWLLSDKSHIAKNLAKKMDGDSELEEIIEAELEKNYREDLY
jgi:PPOX class probable FMN-dependent enzyme